MDRNAIGRRIAAHREMLQMSQEALAEQVGVHPVTVSKWERGVQDIGGVNLGLLAQALGVTADTLINDSVNVSRETLGQGSGPSARRALLLISEANAWDESGDIENGLQAWADALEKAAADTVIERPDLAFVASFASRSLARLARDAGDRVLRATGQLPEPRKAKDQSA